MKIPFIDLRAQYRAIKEEVDPVVLDAMANGAFIGGPQVDNFEKEFATFCRSGYCAGVNSGTDALRFALIAAGIAEGDEVITVPNTFIATTEAISQVGAVPVFVDVRRDTYNIDVSLIEKRITRKTKAIIPVHLYGQMTDMDPIMDIAVKKKLVVIEDACQAHGAEYKGRMAGSIGDAGCFSFYPGKNMGAFGEGGAVVSNDEALIQKIKMIRNHGQSRKYYHEIEGYNGRLDAIQAGILRVKLRRLPGWNEARRRNAKKYNELLSSVDGVETPFEPEYTRGVYHLYELRTGKRDGLQQHLNSRGIETGLHYPLPLHLQKSYLKLGYRAGDFPETESSAGELISLPMFPELSEEQIRYVVDCIAEFGR